MAENLDADELQSNRELSPGQLLSQGRLQAGLTQKQVAKELYMSASKVQALETDDYACLCSDTFVRGYIRSYASLVKIDAALVVTAYDQFIDGLTPKTAIPAHAVVAETGHRGAWQFLAVIGAFFLGLWLMSVWFFDNHSEAQYAVPTTDITSVADVKSSLAAALAIANDLNTSESTVKTMDMAKTVVSVSNSMVATSKVTAPVIASSAAISSVAAMVHINTSSSSAKKTSLDEISFSFRKECWLEVSDSRGDVLAAELELAGSTIKLVGIAPFDVKLGNASAVDIQLNGKKIDIIPLPGSSVIILKVGN